MKKAKNKFKKFSFENYYSPETHFVREDWVDDGFIAEMIINKAKFDKVDGNVALERMHDADTEIVEVEEKHINIIPVEGGGFEAADGKTYKVADFIYLLQSRDWRFKYGILENGEQVFF